MRGLRAIPLVALVGLFASSARAQAPTPARQELEQGYELRKTGHFVEALPHLLESYRLDPQLKTLINLADCEENVGQLVNARRHWSDARDQAVKEADSDIQQEAARRIEALDKRMPKLRLVLAPDAPPGTKVDDNGAPLAAGAIGSYESTDPGRHVLTVHAEGREPKAYEIILKSEETRDLTVGLATQAPATVPAEPESPSSPLRTVGLVVAGAGVVAIGVGAVFGIEAKSNQDGAHCPGNVCTLAAGGNPDTLRTAITDGNLATVFFIAGGVLAAGGITMWLVAPHGTGKTAGATVRAVPLTSRGGGGLGVVGTW